MFNRFPKLVGSAYWICLALMVCTGTPATVVHAASPQIDPNEGRPHVKWTDAEQVVGRIAYVSGRIVDVGHGRTIHFLNFDKERSKPFKVVVFDRYASAFGGSFEDLYLGKIIRVRGMVTRYAGNPQIQATSPDQIEVLDAMPEFKSPAKHRKSVGNEITLATYNIRNLYDDDDEPYHNDDTTPSKPRREMERVADVIRRLDADVLALQEVENRGYLERYVEVFLPDMGYEHIVHYEGNDLRGSDVCLMSRLPVGEVSSYRHLRFPDKNGKMIGFSRDVISVEIVPPGGDRFEVWVLHLKSNHDGRPYAEPRRVGEARTIRRLLDERLEQNKSAAIVVCGDYNDTPESETVQTIIGSGAKAMRSFYDESAVKGKVTYNQEPYLTMIDFILCTDAMAKRYVAESYKVFSSTLEASGSDHNPVVARFRIR